MSITLKTGGPDGFITVNTTTSGGFNNAVALSASGVPRLTFVSFDPASIPAPGSGTSTLDIVVGAGATAGTYTVSVTGSGRGKVHSVPLTLVIQIGPPQKVVGATPTPES